MTSYINPKEKDSHTLQEGEPHETLDHSPCFCMTLKNLTMTFELGRIMTCLLPAFSALLMLLRASLSTLVRTILEAGVLMRRTKKTTADQDLRFSSPKE